MNEKKAIFLIDIIKNSISVYFDTFFVFYFFQVANYEVIPLAKYYLTLYFFVGIGFFLIRKSMKQNVKVPYFKIGISLQALYIMLIMLLKDNIINHIFLVGFVKGIADGFYYFPKNILNTEKITNEDRQQFNGLSNTVNKIISILIPLCLGVALTYMTYVDLGKIFFVLFIILFLLSFYIKDKKYTQDKFEFKKLWEIIKTNRIIRNTFIVIFLTGFTYSSGVMDTIITLSKINNFKTNLNLGIVDSICALLSLLVCILFTVKIKEKHFKKVLLVSSFCSFICMILFSIYKEPWVLIIYLFVRFTFILIISLIADYWVVNLSNSKELKETYKSEFYLMNDALLAISRCIGYLSLLLICLTLGMENINYLMLLPAFAILLEGLLLSKLNS